MRVAKEVAAEEIEPAAVPARPRRLHPLCADWLGLSVAHGSGQRVHASHARHEGRRELRDARRSRWPAEQRHGGGEKEVMMRGGEVGEVHKSC